MPLWYFIFLIFLSFYNTHSPLSHVLDPSSSSSLSTISFSFSYSPCFISHFSQTSLSLSLSLSLSPSLPLSPPLSLSPSLSLSLSLSLSFPFNNHYLMISSSATPECNQAWLKCFEIIPKWSIMKSLNRIILFWSHISKNPFTWAYKKAIYPFLLL